MLPGPDIVLACPHCGAPHRSPSLATDNTFGAERWSDGWFETAMRASLPTVARCVGCRVFFWVERARRLCDLDSISEWREEPHTRLILDHAGKRRVDVRHLLLQELGTNLEDVRRRMDRLPTPIGQYRTREEARKVTLRFEHQGAAVSSQEVAVKVPLDTRPAEWRQAPRIRLEDEALLLDALREGLARTLDEERELRRWTWWRGNDAFRGGDAWVPLSQRDYEVRENARALMALCSSEGTEPRWLHAELLRELERFEEALVLLDRMPSPELEPLRDAARRRDSRLLPLPFPVRESPASEP
ncbi:hypothetical protein LZ198_17200 [Myxococcus sp. K15C18031901]|uniref:hypothetical protein n=1 Tax=Myxococcus dinghuensis TaxID=2906761 RepID=UPI0020A76CBB|nr:hypothetical protein [Myxococcus dinghuensis]MCP3100610.1 hypothetical protein [Myxococcus dinghuensis]